MFWDDHVNRPRIPLFRASKGEKDWGDSLLQGCGRVRLIEHAVEMERIQLARIMRIGENTFECMFSESATGVESIEKRDSDIFNVLLDRRHQRERVWDKLAEKRPEIVKRMRELVSPWERHYIRYGAAPEVDDYYHDLSSAIPAGPLASHYMIGQGRLLDL